MIKPVIKIFCDFDGTITQTDIGNAFYRRFGKADECDVIVNEWRNGEITSSECLSRECETISDLDYSKFDSFISEYKIDDGFNSFYEFCIERGIEIYVLSDGIGYYIKSFLRDYPELKIYSNEIIIKDDGTAFMEYPYPDNVCDKCANCKRNHVINNSSDDDISIYIGDGFSDFCPVGYCDIIFAKKDLRKNCEINKFPFYPFDNFYDVLPILKKITEKKRLKKRNQALLKRKELYLLEA